MVVQLLTSRQLEDKLGINKRRLLYLRSIGLPVILLTEKLIRYDYDDVKKWLQETNQPEASAS